MFIFMVDLRVNLHYTAYQLCCFAAVHVNLRFLLVFCSVKNGEGNEIL